MSNKAPAVEVRGNLVTVNGNGLLFDTRPVEIGGFRLRGRSILAVGRPSIKGFQEALALACEFHESSPYWIGGLISYADTREDWKEKLSQAMTVTGLAEQTLHNLGYVYRQTTDKTRALAPTPAHAAEVAPLTEDEQVEWLEKARTDGLTVRDLRLTMRAAKRRKVIEGQAVLEGMYRVIYADPPWQYSDRPHGSRTGQEEQYDGMPMEEIAKMPVQAHALPNAVLFMWVTAPFLYLNPGPRDIIEQWGFSPKSQFVWDKVKHNWGNYVSVRHEFLIIATRGSCTPDRPVPMIDSVQTEQPRGDHSAKPEMFRQHIERLYDGPYLELFGRERVPGWTVWGNDARLLSEGVTV